MVEALANILKDFYLMSNWYYSLFRYTYLLEVQFEKEKTSSAIHATIFIYSRRLKYIS
jgi:hypothetical protein